MARLSITYSDDKIEGLGVDITDAPDVLTTPKFGGEIGMALWLLQTMIDERRGVGLAAQMERAGLSKAEIKSLIN